MTIAEGWRAIATVYLPPLAGLIGDITQPLFDMLRTLGNIGRVAALIVSGDFSAADQAFQDMKKSWKDWRNSSENVVSGKILDTYMDDFARRLVDYEKAWDPAKTRSATAAPRISAAPEEDKKLKGLQEDWGKTLRDLNADVAKSGLSEFGKRLEEIDNKASDLIEKFKRIPGASASIRSWAAAMKSQAKAEEEAARSSASREAFLKAASAAVQADRDLTESLRTEAQRRIDAATDAADKQRQAWLDAYNAGVLDAEDYGRKIAAVDAAEAQQRRRIQGEADKAVREAEINARLAALDLLEAEGAAHRTTLAERIRLTNELAAAQSDYLAGLDKAQDPAAWYAQAEALGKTRAALAGLRRELDLQDPLRAAVRALDDLSDAWTDTGRQMHDVAKQTAESMQQAFSDFFFDSFQGKLKSLGDYITAFLTSVQRAIAQVLSQQVTAGALGTEPLWGSVPNALEGLNLGTLFGVSFHQGGMVGQTGGSYRIVPNIAFAGAPRMHGGGYLAPDEVPAILQKGEWVLSRRDVQALGTEPHRGSVPPNVEINIINRSGTDLSGTQQGTPRFDGKKWILDIVVEGMGRYAPLKTAIGNMRS